MQAPICSGPALRLYMQAACKVALSDLSWTDLVSLTPSVFPIGPTADAISTPPGLSTLKHSAKHLHIRDQLVGTKSGKICST